jgi:7-cyano-7-deazaguanine tRNA-ribosyltransferase
LFEIIKGDLAGRIGILHTNHGKIETPAFVPVIHPVKQTIPTKKIGKLGFDLVITNAYITLNHYGDEATKSGIHKIIDFDGAVMTDSGGYQVLEYGDVDVSPDEMWKFENEIGSDIAIPLDKPTGYGLSKKKANSFVEHTLKISKQVLKKENNPGAIWVGPIQGGEHMDLVKKSTKALVDYGFKMLALGSPVEFMEAYEYKLLANMIVSAKKQIPLSIPLHLFGAGHPLTIPLAVALGCDTFDSASYMLYAKHERYMTGDRTLHLSKIQSFSCMCEICSKYNPKELLALNKDEKTNGIALHNLFVIKSEVDKVKNAIHEGRLWEYVMKKARSHPKLFEAIDVFIENYDHFVKTTPKFKESAIFLFSKIDQFRPEVISYHNIVRKFRTKKKILVIIGDSTRRPFYLSSEYSSVKKKFSNPEVIQFCQYNPFLGLIPLEISDIFPAAHYVMARLDFNPNDFPIFLKTWEAFFEKNHFTEIYCDKKDEFLKFFLKKLPKQIKKKSVS